MYFVLFQTDSCLLVFFEKRKVCNPCLFAEDFLQDNILHFIVVIRNKNSSGKLI